MKHNRLVGSARQKFIHKFFGPDRILDLGLRFGPYGAKLNPFSKGLTLRRVQNAVHGIDLGPLTPCLLQRLKTADKLIDLAPEILVQDLERVERGLISKSSEANGHLLLIGRRQLRSNNSWMHNSLRLVKGNPAKPPCSVLINPSDAADRDLISGEMVQVRSSVGSIVLPLEVSDEVMRGVISIPHGWGHDRSGNQMGVAREHAGASINDLTDASAIDALCGTAAFNGTSVTVAAYKSS
jgi:anaerobic selenocysteine-containing dehydrogenase